MMTANLLRSRLNVYEFLSNLISQENNEEGASESEIKDLIGPPKDLMFANVLEKGFKTLDGRVSDAHFATPGGDAGEFLLALQIFNEMKPASIELNQQKVLNIFKDYLSYMKQSSFYMATDDVAVQHLEK